MITKSDMTELENQAEAKGISKLTLMENAGTEAAKIIEEKFEIKGKRILVVCYHGNNGGDGFVVARLLGEKAEVDVLFIGEESRLKPEAEINFKKVEEDQIIQFIGLDYVDFNDYGLIVDAILGTGVKGELKPIIQSTIESINLSSAKKISLDIPTGLDPDTGKSAELTINPDLIITFHDMKPGLQQFKDKTIIADIGL